MKPLVPHYWALSFYLIQFVEFMISKRFIFVVHNLVIKLETIIMEPNKSKKL